MLVALVVLADPKFSGLHEHELPVPPVVFGLVGFVVFLFLLALTFAFANVGKRH